MAAKRNRDKSWRAGRAALCLLFFLIACPLLGSAASKPIYKDPRPKRDLEKAKGEDTYSYNPQGKVDPFVPFIKREEVEPDSGGETVVAPHSLEQRIRGLLPSDIVNRVHPLQKFKLSELTVTAIIKKKGETKAMVRDPKGRGFIIKEGTPIGRNYGRVHKIVSKTEKGPMGVKWERKVIIKEPENVRGNKLEYKFVEMELPLSKEF